jgi:hypothetical protein
MRELFWIFLPIILLFGLVALAGYVAHKDAQAAQRKWRSF